MKKARTVVSTQAYHHNSKMSSSLIFRVLKKVLTVKRSVIYIEAVLVSVTFSDFIEVVGTGTHVKTPVITSKRH